MSHTTSPQSKLVGKSKAKVIKSVGVFNPFGRQLDTLNPPQIVEIEGHPEIVGQNIRWWVKDPDARGGGYSFELLNGEYCLEPVQ